MDEGIRQRVIEQLQTVAAQAEAEFLPSTPGEAPAAIAQRALEHARTRYFDVLIVDTAGTHSLSSCRSALTRRGTYVAVGAPSGRWFKGPDRLLRALVLSPFVSQKMVPFIAKANSEDLAVLKDLIEAGKVTQVIDRTYPLIETPEAIRYLEEGHARGKVVVTVDEARTEPG